jgi:photosystem II stability/assembly factor-like uncharacterized protein
MTLRDDVRDYFEREARRLPAPAGLRVDVTAQAPAAWPASQRTIRWAAVLAAVLAVAIISGLVASGRLREMFGPQVTPGGHIRVTSSQVAQVLDFDLADRNHGWVLIAVCDQTTSSLGPCQFWVEATRDGGRSWGYVVKVGPAYATVEADSPRHIHFASARDGFVYGLGVAFVTHDGGATWTQLPGQTSELVTITGFATIWAVLQQCTPPGRCTYGVRVSSDGGRSFSAATPLPAGFQPEQVVAFGPAGLLLAGPGSGDMAITEDAGRTWRSIAGRCSADAVGNYIATSDGQELWQLCNVTETPIVMRLFTSEDSGRTWVESSGLPGQGMAPSLAIQTIFLVSPRPGWVLFTTGEVPIELSTDSGRTWTPVTSTAYYDKVVFCSSDEGWAEHGAIYATHDGGRTWTKLASEPV